MELTDFGWRDGLLLAIVLAVVYLLVALLGLARLRGRRESGLADMPAGRPEVRNFGGTSGEPPAASGEKDAPAAAPFAAHLALTELEAEVKELRAEVSVLREQLSELKATRRISPLYADAAALARRGFDARGVAHECGISVAEAELVLAMSRGDKDFESELNDGQDGEVDGTRAAR